MKVSINILYVLHSSSKYEGSSRSFLSSLEGLVKKGISPHVVLPMRSDMSILEELDRLKVPYTIMKYLMPIYPKKTCLKDYILYIPRFMQMLTYQYLTVLRLFRLIKRANFDLVHSNAGPLLCGYKASQLTKLPHVWHLREYQDLDFNLNTTYALDSFRNWLRASNVYPIAISQSVYRHFGLDGKARMIYNGVMSSLDAKINYNKEKYFLFVGGLHENKGVRFLIEAFSLLLIKYPDQKLYIVGDTVNKTYKDYLISLVVKNSLEANIIFLGKRDDVLLLMSNAKAIIVPSVSEAFGRITAEAMFKGCLVIGNNSGGTKEILEDNDLGVLYNGENELLGVLENVVENGTEYYYDKIQRAAQYAVDMYSQEQNVDSIYCYYQDILNG